MKITGAQALIKALEMEGVEVMFGLNPTPGTLRRRVSYTSPRRA